jgi:uncharacterized protein with NRDE domain
MCTVSFIRTKRAVVITSNRDEHSTRALAIAPKNYIVDSQNIIFPKDPQAGGTWFGIANKKTVIVLLNGADEKHTSKPPYAKSRGIIMLEMLSSINPKMFWISLNLENIEPFTIVLFQENQLFQLRWNGSEKTTKVLDAYQNHIWSSATLYEKNIREKRQLWFTDFLDKNNEPLADTIFDFHQKTKNNDLENGLCIARSNGMKTVSISQCVIKSDKLIILHADLVQNKRHDMLLYI